MKISDLLAGAALTALVLGSAGEAAATTIPLGGYTGPIQIIFNNYETFTGTHTLAVSNSNYGILQVTSILDNASNIIYSAPVTPTATNPLIVGVFSGIHVGSLTGNTSQADLPGAFSFYYDTTTTFGTLAALGLTGYTTGGCSGVNTQCYNGITNKGFENLLNFSLVPGADSTDTGSFLEAVTTSTNPLVGDAEGYADITGGTDAAQFATGTQTTAAGTPADLFIKDSFCASGQPYCAKLPGPPGQQFTLGSNDPVVTSIRAPEPGSLALLGSALLGLAGVVRRRRTKADV